MEAKHTPAPWSIVDKHPQRAVVEIMAEGDTILAVATLYAGHGDGFSENKNRVTINDHIRMANARLIAAAPDMLKALEDVEAKISSLNDSKEAIQVRAAIAKAKGL